MRDAEHPSNLRKKVRRKRGRPKKIQVDTVLESAMQAYWFGDPKSVSINMICKTMGISKPSLYREFKNEDDLMCAALDRYSEQIIPDLFKILTQDSSLVDILNQLIGYICDQPKFEHGCLFQKLYYSQHDLGPQTLARVQKLRAKAQESFESCLKSHLSQDSQSDRLGVKLKAHYLAEQLMWAVNLRSLGMSGGQVRQLLTLALSSLLPSYIQDQSLWSHHGGKSS